MSLTSLCVYLAEFHFIQPLEPSPVNVDIAPLKGNKELGPFLLLVIEDKTENQGHLHYYKLAHT